MAQEAQAERTEAQRQAAIGLASEAANHMQGPGYDLARSLALEAVERYPYAWQAERALADAVRDHPILWQFTGGVPILAAPYVSPDGDRFLTASNDGVLRVWKLASRTVSVEVQAYEGQEANYHQALWSPTGDRILTVSWGEKPRIWDAATGDLLADLSGHGGWFGEWSPDGTRVLTYFSSHEDAATLWDARTGEVMRPFPGSLGMVRFAHFSPDGGAVATSLGEIYDAETGTLKQTLDTYQDSITGDRQLLPTWSPDGSTLAAWSRRDYVRVGRRFGR